MADGAPVLSSAAQAFRGTELWIFDLDNTLYPSECNLFAEIDRRMTAFIGKLLGLDPAAARKVQKELLLRARDHAFRADGQARREA